jgi:RHS repeat-associated protein
MVGLLNYANIFTQMTIVRANTGLFYYGARHYDAKISVWLSVDPLAAKYPGWSPYNFTMNNPLNLADPDGMAPTKPRTSGSFSTANRLVQKSTTGVSAHLVIPSDRKTLEVGRDGFYMTTVGWFYAAADLLYSGYTGSKSSTRFSKDVAINTTEKILGTYGTELCKAAAKNGGTALGLFSIYASATKPDSRQETLENLTFKVMKAAFNAEDVISQKGEAINFPGQKNPEDVANLLNATYNVLDAILKPEEFDLTTSQGQEAAFRHLQENLASIKEQINETL